MATLSNNTPLLVANQPPLLKWAGGKRWIADHLQSIFPSKYRRYFEPFFGGGAVFFGLQPGFSVISDINSDLIECYQQVRDSPEDVILYLQQMENSEENYYIIRSIN